MEKRKLVDVFDKRYGPGHAMKWRAGAFFPGSHSYAGIEVGTQRQEIQAEYVRGLMKLSVEEEQLHNTLPARAGWRCGMDEVWEEKKPPP